MNNWNLFKFFKEIKKYNDLLYMLTWRDIKIKYKQSIMGFMWAIFMPIVIVSAGILVRYAFSKLSGEPVTVKDIAAVSVKAVPWAFFVASIRFATTSLISNSNLITKIYFPRELFPIAAILSQLFDFFIAAIVLSLILTVAKIGVSIQLFWVPVLVIFLVILVFSFGIILSAFALFFRDVKYLVEVIITFGIFFTPVFYEVEMFGNWAPLLLLNPIAPILEGLNTTIVHQQTPPIVWIGYSVIFSISALIISIHIFKNMEPAFAENI
jgi:ABC-type polysaccharide/polyol phosphate export permease